MKMWTKKVRGKTNGIEVELSIPDDTPDGEKIQAVKALENLINRFDSPDDFAASLMRCGAQLTTTYKDN